jgi:DNA-binding transcriptional LysR family regulator
VAKQHPSSNCPPRRYFKEVRFRQLHALVEFDRTGGFAPAAGALGLSVPSVWQQIRALELEYGVALVDSQGPLMFLTAEGRMLVDVAAPWWKVLILWVPPLK